MIEENSTIDEPTHKFDEGLDYSRRPEYYDGLICVRSPYTGVLDAPATTDSTSPEGAVESIPF